MNNIVFNGICDDLIIEKSEVNKTYIDYYETGIFEYEIKYYPKFKTLYIKQKGYKFGNKKNIIKIFYYGEIDDLTINSKYGDIDINSVDVDDSINITAENSDIYIKRSFSDRLSLELDSCDVILDNIRTYIFDIKSVDTNFEMINSFCYSSTVNIKNGDFIFDGRILRKLACNIKNGDCKLVLDQDKNNVKINDEGSGYIVINHNITDGKFKISYRD